MHVKETSAYHSVIDCSVHCRDFPFKLIQHQTRSPNIIHIQATLILGYDYSVFRIFYKSH
jgi:hypothetical protein